MQNHLFIIDYDTKFSIFVVIVIVMGTKEKLIERFLTLPKDFTYDEVKRLLGLFGYRERYKGSTSGSRVEFIDSTSTFSFIMHKPHPSNIIKGYIMKQLFTYIHDNKLLDSYYNSKKSK